MALGMFLEAGARVQDYDTPSFQLLDGLLRPMARAPWSTTTFGVWCTAFLRFSGVYLEMHPGAADGLMTHMLQVCQLTAPGLGPAWRDLDEAYRRVRKSTPGRHPWGGTTSSSPLCLQAPRLCGCTSVAQGIRGATRQQPSLPRQPATGRNPFRRCFTFNRGGCSARGCRLPMSAASVGDIIPPPPPAVRPPPGHPDHVQGRLPLARPRPVPSAFDNPATAVSFSPSVPPDRVDMLLAGYDVGLRLYLVSGLTLGLSNGCADLIAGDAAINLPSCLEAPAVIDEYIQRELDASRLVGPFASHCAAVSRISPVGLIPKKTPGAFRVIHHISYPLGESANDHISREHTAVQYESIHDAVKLLAQLDASFLAKTDISACFS